jgi:thymidylate kinase
MYLTPPPNVGPAVNELFEEFKKQNVKFCVLTDFEGLPEVISSVDIDIIVVKKQKSRAICVLKAVFRKHGLTYYSEHRFKEMITYIFHFQDKDNRFIYSLKIDLKVNVEVRGRTFLTSEEILAGVRPYKNFFVPCRAHQTAIGILNTILKGSPAWQKSGIKIQDGLHGENREIEALVKRAFRKSTTKFLMSNMASGNIEEIEKIRRNLFLESYVISFIRNPARFTLRLGSHYLHLAGRLIRHPNYMIALLGPDGVGKSSLIENIRCEIDEVLKIGYERTLSYHIRPSLFPTITELFRKKGYSDKRRSLAYDTWKSTSLVISFIRLLCFWSDYVVGYMIKILPQLANYNVIILDRYFYDLMIDPLRYNIKLPDGLLNGFLARLPQPEVAFVLDAPADIILDRKHELTREKIDTLLTKYKKLGANFDNIHVLDATKPPEKLASEAVSIFLAKASMKLT